MLNLSKDKSFSTMLAKADLDENTSNLLKQNPSPSEIKYSLLENMNSSNIVKYRRLIEKAEEEETRLSERLAQEEAERAKEQAEAERDKETQQRIGVDEDEIEVQEKESQKERALREAKEGEARQAFDDRRSAERGLRQAQNWSEELFDLVMNFRKVGDGYRMADYIKFGKNINESNNVISMVSMISKDRNALQKKYSKFLTSKDGKKLFIPQKMDKETGKTSDISERAIDVSDIDSKVSKLADEDLDEGKKLLEVLIQMHLKQHGRQPTVARGKGFSQRRLTELQDVQSRAMGINRQTERDFERLTKTVKSIQSRMDKLTRTANSLKENIKDLEESSSVVDKLITKKINDLTRSYKSILDSSRVADTDKLSSSLKEIASKIKDIRDNPDKYVDEIKQEFQESIEKEKLKLETIVKSIEQEEKMVPLFRRIKNIVREITLAGDTEFIEGKRADLQNKLSRGVITQNEYDSELDEIEQRGVKLNQRAKEKINKANSVLIDLKHLARKMIRANQDIPEEIEDSLSEFLRGGGTISLGAGGNVLRTNIKSSGISDVREEQVVSINELSIEFDEKRQKLEDILNEYEQEVSEATSYRDRMEPKEEFTYTTRMG
jgi:cell division protein FtsB